MRMQIQANDTDDDEDPVLLFARVAACAAELAKHTRTPMLRRTYFRHVRGIVQRGVPGTYDYLFELYEPSIVQRDPVAFEAEIEADYDLLEQRIDISHQPPIK